MSTTCSRCTIALLFALVTWTTGCGNDPVSLVRNGRLERHKSTSVGDAIDNYRYFRGVKWRPATTANGRQIVEADCPVALDLMTAGDLNARYLATAGIEPEASDNPVSKRKLSERIREATATFRFVVNEDDTFELKDAAIRFIAPNGKGGTIPWDDQTLTQSLGDIYENQIAIAFLAMLPLASEN